MAPLIQDARRRQRRRWVGLAALIVVACAGAAIAVAVVSSGGASKSTSPPPPPASPRPRPLHPLSVQGDKALVVVARDTGRILRMWCTRGAAHGSWVWVVAPGHAVGQFRPAGLPPRCPS
jgi:hypothetical protein